MSKNVVVVKSMQDLQAAVQKKYGDVATQIKDKLSAPAGSAISVKGKQFRLPGQEMRDASPGPIRAVIVDFVSRNTYYEGAYNAKQMESPACWAEGPTPDGLIPSAASTRIQGAACDECPQNEWGSAAQGNGKACKNIRVLALLPADDPTADIMTLNVSPTATKNFDAYIRTLSVVHGIPPFAVSTEISFDENETYPKLQFASPEPNDAFEAFGARVEEAEKALKARYTTD